MLRLTVLLVVGILVQESLTDEPESIVGGQQAAPGEFPYQCSMKWYDEHICGCSIISETQVLTAAHCVYDITSYRNVSIVTGSIDVNAGQEHNVKSIHIHPGYVDSVKKSWINDIAVVTLTAPIRFNSLQKPIALPTSAPVSGTACVLSGWGLIRVNGPSPDNLLKMNTFIVPLNECRSIHRLNIYDTHVCAFIKKDVGACQGDSGGPLVCNGKQYGIVSWSLRCASGVPDVYTSVYNYLDFINEMKKYA